MSTKQDKNNLIAVINNLSYNNNQVSVTGDALDLAYRVFFSDPRDVIPRVAILYTDGPRNPGANIYDAANELKYANVNLFSIGIGPSINMNLLNLISSAPSSEYVLLLSNYYQIYSKINSITTLACNVPVFINSLF